MTQAQLNRSIAGLTGESPRTIHRLGFGIEPIKQGDRQPNDLHLVVDCPFCGRPVPYPGTVREDSLALAECTEPRCDVFFDFPITDVYVARS
jgi:hypothetical protein